MYGATGGSVEATPPPIGVTDPGGYQPVDAYGYPINPGFYGNASGTAGAGPTVQVPTDPYGGGNVAGGVGGIPGVNSPTGNFNYYDAGNGVVYVYDSNWNYVGTTGGMNNNIAAGNQTPPSSSTGSTGSVVTTSFNAVNNNAPTARPGGWDIFGSSVNWGPSGGIGPQPNIADTAITGAKPSGQLL